MNRKTKKRFAALTYILLALAAAYLGLRIFWGLQPANILTIKNNPVPVRPKEISPEATVIASPQICKTKKAEAAVKRNLVSDTLVQQLPGYTNVLPKGCTSPELAVIIPGNVPDGVYHLEYTITYQINPIKIEVDHWHTQNFTVHHVPPLPTPAITATPTSTVVTPTQTTTITNTSSTSNTSVTTATAAPKQKNVLEKVGQSISGIIESIKRSL